MKMPFDHLFYNVERREVERLDLRGVRKFIFSLNKLKSNAHQKACIFIDGYNETTEELYEIPEVRLYVEKVIEKFPHLLYFLNPMLEAHVYILASLSNVTTTYMSEERKLTPAEYFELGVQGPQTVIQMKLHDKWYYKMYDALIEYQNICKDPEGIKKALALLEQFR